MVSRLEKIGELIWPKKWRLAPELSTGARIRAIEERNRALPKYKDINLIRIAENRDDVSQERPHEMSTCVRCCRIGQSTGAATQIRKADHIEFSANGLVLAESLNLRLDSNSATHDVCLFAIDDIQGIGDQIAIAKNVQDLLRSGKVYHTIRHPLPKHFYERHNTIRVEWSDTIWNLPLPQRAPTDKEHRDILNWILELGGEHLVVQGTADELECQRNTLQVLLHFLNTGLDLQTTTEEADQFRLLPDRHMVAHSLRGRNDLYRRKDREEQEERKDAGKGDDRDVIFMTHRAANFDIGDANLRNYHGFRF